MSLNSSSRVSKINIPRMVLWLASIVVAVVGYILLTSSTSAAAAVYTSGKADYTKLLAAQSGSTVGGLLIAVGVLGALLALTSMTLTRRPVAAPEVGVLAPTVLDPAALNNEIPTATPAAAPGAPAAKAPDAEPTSAR